MPALLRINASLCLSGENAGLKSPNHLAEGEVRMRFSRVSIEIRERPVEVPLPSLTTSPLLSGDHARWPKKDSSCSCLQMPASFAIKFGEEPCKRRKESCRRCAGKRHGLSLDPQLTYSAEF